jgi:diguanylate cyclase (GGDEF)-like protein
MRIATMPMVAGALLLPAPLVMLCGFAFAVHRMGSPLMLRQRVFNGCNHALSGVAAWGAVWLLRGVGRPSDARLALVGVVATAIYVLLSWGLLVSILHLTRDLAISDMRQQLPALLAAEGGLGALGIAVAGLWHAHATLVPFAISPLVLIWTSLKISELRQEANVDSKTGLYNARHLRGVLDAEIDRAIRYQRPLTLLVCDLDFLREVNNMHGHLFGDVVIAGVADVLRGQLRSTDLASRFGGEEFVVLLPETPPSRGVQVAERIRRAVAERAFPGPREAPAIYVTISIGLASFPADATSGEELLNAADEAVYRAKAAGRNRVAVAADQPLALQV